jgi:hypothetical protein
MINIYKPTNARLIYKKNNVIIMVADYKGEIYYEHSIDSS